MYYRLKEPWAFRGWKGLPYAITAMFGEYRHRTPYFFNKDVFLDLLSCCGEEDIDIATFHPESQKVINEFLEHDMMTLGTEPLGELQGWQRYAVYPSRYLQAALWSITDQCNFQCRHCLLSAPLVISRADTANPGDISRIGGRFSKHLSIEDCLHIAREFASCGIKRVDLTGGEPLLRNDLETVVNALTSFGIDIGVFFTNASLLTAKTLELFEKAHQRPMFQISFDGLGHHDWLRGVPGAERSADVAFKLLKGRNFPVSAAMCIHKENRGSLRDTVNYLASIGVDTLRVSAPQSLGLWRDSSLEYALSEQEEWETYREYIDRYFEDGMPITIALGGYFFCPSRSTQYEVPFVKHYPSDTDWSKMYYCGSMQGHIYINAEGRLLPCMGFSDTQIENTFPCILEQSLGSATLDSKWLDVTITRVSDLIERNPQCAACEHLHRCGGGCMTQDMSKEGDFLTPDSRCCYFHKHIGETSVREAADSAIHKHCSKEKEEKQNGKSSGV